MKYEQDYAGCLGTAPCLSSDRFNHYLTKAQEAAQNIQKELTEGKLPAFTICKEQADLDALKPIVQDYTNRLDHLVVLGTGGSSLGGQTLNALMTLGFNKAKPKV